MNKTALITGVTGQDGAYLAQQLLLKNYNVIGLTRSSNPGSLYNLKYLNILNELNIQNLDLLDVLSLVNLLKKYNFDEIYHLSAQSSVSISYKQPYSSINYNTLSTLNLLETIRMISPHTKILNPASSDMYGVNNQLPITEEMKFNPQSPYAISKVSSYSTVKLFRDAYNIYAVNAILFNHESFLRSDNFFIKKVIKTAILISGGFQHDLHVGNIEVKRDFGFAPEYTKAMHLMLQIGIPDDFIICSGVSIKLRQVVEYVFDYFNIPFNLIVVDENLFRESEIIDIYGDASKFKAVSGWEYNFDFFKVLDLLIQEELNSLKNKLV